jgi:hypothetical protein
MEEGSELERFYQEEAARREAGSVTSLLHSILKERYLLMTEKVQHSTYWPGGGIVTVPSSLKKATKLEENRKDPTPPADDQLLDALGGIED